MIDLIIKEKKLSILYDGKLILEHSKDFPLIEIGEGEADIDGFRGNFTFKDHIKNKQFLNEYEIIENILEMKTIKFYSKDYSAIVEMWEEGERLKLKITTTGTANRFFINLPAEKDEQVWGCGEQFSCFNLRGKKFPIWTQEQGVGRNKKRIITKIADIQKAGGDYHTTFYPQPTFISSRGYFFHANTFSYSVFDFTKNDHHSILFWKIPEEIIISSKKSLMETVQDISQVLGRQGELADWTYDGLVLGVQGGTEKAKHYLEVARNNGIPVAGIWAQDWEGKKVTSFGSRLKWNWEWDKIWYPDLDNWIKKLNKEGIKFLGYINPYLLKDKPLFDEASTKGYLALNMEGKDYLVDFGEFNCGIVDFTNPKAFDWYKKVIKKNLIDFGLNGWMADFGEYLPIDAVLFNKMDPLEAHNLWPGLWAKLNYEVVQEAGLKKDNLFFMRAGNSLSLKYCNLIWAGDQNVDWSKDDGIKSVVTASLSLAMSGYGLSSSDIGGYTTLFYLKRSKELLLRWAELSAFSPFMRTHEGNRPERNWQFYSDADTMKKLSIISKIHVHLKPYLKDAVKQNSQEGKPVIRPLFLHYDEPWCRTVKDEYLLGEDLLVCPVLTKNKRTQKVRLPQDEWIHLFTGEEFLGGFSQVSCLITKPPVFYKKTSKFSKLFKEFLCK